MKIGIITHYTETSKNWLFSQVLLCFKNYAKPSTLAILAAGDRTLLNDYQNCLQSLGDKLFFLGKAGNAAKLYLVLRAISGVITQGLAEGMAFGKLHKKLTNRQSNKTNGSIYFSTNSYRLKCIV